MAPSRKRSVSKRYSKINEVKSNKNAAEIASKSKPQKRKLSQMLGPQWGKEELDQFYKAYQKYGKNWEKVAAVVRNRSMEMVEALYTMNKAYLSLPKGFTSAAGLIAMVTDRYSNLMAGGRGRGGQPAESPDEVDQVSETEDMASLLQSQSLPLVQAPPPPSAPSVQTQPSPLVQPQLQSGVGSASASVGESTNFEANTDGGSGIDRRLVITVENKELLPHEQCSRMITKIFERRLHPDGYAWKKIPQDIKDLYFEDFKKYFQWDPTIDAKVKFLWKKQAAIRYATLIWIVKTTNPRPKYVSDDVWTAWNAGFNTPEYRARAEQNKRNRQAGEPATHTGGSITHSSHAKRMEQSSGKKPTYFELFVHNHTKKSDGSFVNKKAKTLNDAFIRLREEMSQPEEGSSESRQVDDNQIFIDRAGGVKKSRVYGIGSEASTYCNTTPYNVISPSTDHSLELEAQLHQVQKQLKDLQEKQQARELQLQENMRVHMEQMKRQMEGQMQAQLAAFFKAAPQSPTSDSSQWDTDDQ